jgi:hypothetical protein
MLWDLGDGRRIVIVPDLIAVHFDGVVVMAFSNLVLNLAVVFLCHWVISVGCLWSVCPFLKL